MREYIDSWPGRLHRVVSPHFALNRTGRGGRWQNPIRADHLRRATGLLQAPQSARREDDGEEPEPADRKQRPDEEEVSAGIGEPAGDADALPAHVDVGDDQRKERQEEHDYVPRSPFGKHQRSVQPDDGDEHPPNEV